MFQKILPKTFDFFALFDAHIKKTIEAAEKLVTLTQSKKKWEEISNEIKFLEREADNITHSCHESLHNTFITPIERTSIFNLMNRLDDIIDDIYGLSMRFSMYDVEEMRPEAKELSSIILQCTREIAVALADLPNLKNTQTIQSKCVAVRKFESEADMIFRNALTKLFREEKAIVIIKWKEIYERLEKTVDRCEDVVGVIESILIESA
jgi:uncharacterized protein